MTTTVTTDIHMQRAARFDKHVPVIAIRTDAIKKTTLLMLTVHL